MVTLSEKYVNEIRPAIIRDRKYPNPMQAPRLIKIVVNMGLGAALDKDVFASAVEDLGTITGQRPQITKARKSISNFKLREGMAIGAMATLRGARMYEFLDRLINAGLPRIRDFRGVPTTSFDGHGNYSMGITDQAIFPEIDPDKIKKTLGMDITIVTSASSNDEARDLLRMFGMPFATE